MTPRLRSGRRRPLGRRRIRRPAAEHGFATAELAMSLPVVVLLLTAGLFAVNAVTMQVRCVDAAREAAVVAARGGDGLAAGQDRAPPGGRVHLGDDGSLVTATVSVPVGPLGSLLPGMTVSASASAAREPGVAGLGDGLP